ncbi:hypothetical protein GS399_05810 [Pedobacter sp. HMF7647]|uniref:Lipoprotein n=1 Tax=Hufsiella arboris TaxID=2695275 RepID=A0A7K1Y7D4_9SPHI|nr:coiled-coil domain-containing protein 22 [Hufsiella arboris]MXV50482.1 hypothetical protein [Hufsiella arboris]
MKTNVLRLVIFLLFSIGCQTKGWCQKTKTFTLEDCQVNTVLQADKGDSVLIMCDTVYVVNAKTFHLLENLNNKFRSGDYIPKQLYSNASQTIQVQKETLERNQQEYDQLKLRFDSLANNAIKVIDSATGGIKDAQVSISAAMDDTQKLKAELQNVQALLEKEKKQRLKTKITWGIGGAVVGVIAGLLAF